ncbi:MAG: PadR family transcriptional regulator [Propionibacteriaceae bacterium]|nr:PadR family transcriptional regulator [Propionibacteriaceae bacterium]
MPAPVSKDLVAASAAPLVLGILAEGENYGYAILQRIAELSGGRLDWSEGLLYPLLHRLERLGQVEASWGHGASGRRRKYYRLTDRGRTALADHRHAWQAVDATLRTLWADLRSTIEPQPAGI